jgi:YidC/Oxa1 family membrane protein insertase
MKKMKMMQTVFAIVMAGIVVFSATGVGVYWFLNSLFAIAQSYITHIVILRSRRKNNKLESKLEALGF